MPTMNVYRYPHTVIDWDAIARDTHNQYRVLGIRPYSDKMGQLSDGCTLNLQVLHDDSNQIG